MTSPISRRSLLRTGASALTLASAPALWAQGTMKMRLSTAFTEQDLRAEAYKDFAASMKGDFTVEPYWGNTCSSRAPNSWRCSAAISRWATSRRRTSPSRCPRGRS